MIQGEDAKRLLAVLDDFGVPGKQLHLISSGSAQDGLSVIVSKENLHQEQNLREALSAIGTPITWNDSVGAVSIIGAGINASHEKILRGSAALEAIHIVILAIATSSFRITWMIDRSQTDDAARLLHQIFIEADRCSG